MEEKRSRWLVGGAYVGIGLLLAAVLQLRSMEERLSAQTQQIRALGQASEQIAKQLSRLEAGGSARQTLAGEDPEAKLLHPDWPNFFKPNPEKWPPADANTSGVMAMDWASGDPKGFNLLTENYADLQGKLQTFVTLPLGWRHSWTDPGAFAPGLAWRAEVSPDQTEFVFYLRRGVKWQEPTGVDLNSKRYEWLRGEHEVTAHDVKFAFDMLVHPQVQNGALKNYYQELESVEALDDYTVRVRWKKLQALNLGYTMDMVPLPRFLYTRNEDGSEMPEATVAIHFNQHWYDNKGIVGSGPYRFAEYVPGSHIRLERNEDYFGAQPAIRTVKYLIYTDQTQTVLRLKSGELDFGMLKPGQYREEVLRYQEVPESERPEDSAFLDGRIQCELVDYPGYSYVAWNADRALFADKRVRQAMTLAMNRKAIMRDIYSGMGRVAVGPFLDGSPYHDPSIEPWPFDLKRAAQLLKEAGWEDTDQDGLLDRSLEPGQPRRPFEFSFLLPNSSTEGMSAANVFKEDLLSIGVRMRIEAVEWSLMLKRLEEKTFDAEISGWGLDWETDPYQIWHSSQADVPKGSNRAGFRNQRADELIEKLRVTLDEDQRIEMLREFHRIVHEEQPYTFFRVTQYPYCWRSTLHGVKFSKIRPVYNFMPWWSSRVAN